MDRASMEELKSRLRRGQIVAVSTVDPEGAIFRLHPDTEEVWACRFTSATNCGKLGRFLAMVERGECKATLSAEYARAHEVGARVVRGGARRTGGSDQAEEVLVAD